MATAAGQTLGLSGSGLSKSITCTDAAVSLFTVPANVASVTLIISSYGASIMYSQDVAQADALPATGAGGRVDLPVLSVAEVTPMDCGVSGRSSWTIGVASTNGTDFPTVQAKVRVQ